MNLKHFFLFSIAFFSTVLFLSCEQKFEKSKLTIKKSDGTEKTIIIEKAKTQQERAKGFMERKKIPNDTGMIFIFEEDQILHFWMKDTPVPLSIAYINSNGEIKNIYDLHPFSLTSISSTLSCRYALEVPQGWFKQNNIKIGDKISLDF